MGGGDIYTKCLAPSVKALTYVYYNINAKKQKWKNKSTWTAGHLSRTRISLDCQRV